MASFAWPSVIVLRGPKVVHYQVQLECNWIENFSSILELEFLF